MIPDVDAALRTIMISLMTEIAPDVKSAYRQASTNILAIAAMFMADEYDRAAEVRVRENVEMRRLFALCSALVEDATLRSNLENEAQSEDESLRITALNDSNARLKKLLIELQVALEGSDQVVSRDARKRIWTFLRESAERRALRLPG